VDGSRDKLCAAGPELGKACSMGLRSGLEPITIINEKTMCGKTMHRRYFLTINCAIFYRPVGSSPVRLMT
jgi:hypothetical protein